MKNSEKHSSANGVRKEESRDGEDAHDVIAPNALHIGRSGQEAQTFNSRYLNLREGVSSPNLMSTKLQARLTVSKSTGVRRIRFVNKIDARSQKGQT